MRQIRCAQHTLSFEHPQIMGVLNITPDSFSDGGKWLSGDRIDLSAVRDTALQMQAEGAVVLDIGGESTRPGATPVTVTEELQRVIPVLQALQDINIIVSLDTRHAEVAAQGIQAGACLINDVSGGSDPGMLPLIADSDVGFAVMHMQGAPLTMQQQPTYQSVVEEVGHYLAARYQACLASGIAADRLLFDPGFGFGKTLDHNLSLLARLSDVRVDDRPLLVGLSRKSMLGTIIDRPVGQRLSASVSAALLAAQQGADLLRVHDVGPTVDALKVWQALNVHTTSDS